MGLYENTKLLCKENKISMRKLQKILGFPNGTISNWKRYLPSCKRVISVANYFDVSIDYLLGYSENRNAHKKLTDSAVINVTKAAERLGINNDIAAVTIKMMEYMSEYFKEQ